MKNKTVLQIDKLIRDSLTMFAADEHLRRWRAKERDWVNYYAHRYLLEQCSIHGPLLHAAQIGLEVAVPQPQGYVKPTVGRDLVIWSKIGETCWDSNWSPVHHPIAIMEWKVHRPQRRNAKVNHEREWLRKYCKWQPSVVAYAVEVSGDSVGCPLTCTRFLGLKKEQLWLDLKCL